MDKENVKGRDNIAREILQVLSINIRRLFKLNSPDYDKLQEIRVRAGMPLILIYDGVEKFLSDDAVMTTDIRKAHMVTASEVSETMEYISNYSRYAFEEEIRQGYITVQGGHRVGIAGKIIWDRGRIKGINYVSFINIRLAHEIKGCGRSVIRYLREEGLFRHTLIISPPRCGKTTLLRDIIRILADGDGRYPGMTVGVVDERSEIGACYMGKPQNDLGCRSDILDGCPKAEGMMMLVRSMAPEVIAVDEIGSKEDVEAMEYVMNCGINLIATVHGRDMDEIKNKPVLGRMVRERLFKRYILLKPGRVGTIEAIFDDRGSVLYGSPCQNIDGVISA